MATLFGYSVEDQDGKLVITVHGEYAEKALSSLREGLTSGNRFLLEDFLAPLEPLRRLFSPQVELRGGTKQNIKGLEAGDEELFDSDETEGLLSQGIDQTFASFQEQMTDFQRSLDEFKVEMGTQENQTQASAEAEVPTADRKSKK